MKIIVESLRNINVCKLPGNIDGNYWIVDENSKNLLNVIAEEGKWVLYSNSEVKFSKTLPDSELTNVNYIESEVLEENSFYYVVNIMTKDRYKLYILPSFENYENFVVSYNDNSIINIGKSSECEICINNILFNDKQIIIEYNKDNNNILIKNLDVNNKMFVNNDVYEQKSLVNGDIIFISGIYIYFFGALLLINNKQSIVVNSVKINRRLIKENPVVDYSNLIDKDIKFFDKEKFFQRPPRFKRQIENKIFNIDAPTQKENQQETPLIFTLAPMITMGMMSLTTGYNSLEKIIDGERTIKDEFTSLLMCGCMMITTIIFPLIQKFYNKVKKKQKESKRRKKYQKYINERRDEIFKEINYQKQVLIEDNLPLEKVNNIILNNSRNLWERKLEHSDFLELRLGIGTKKPEIDIKYPEEHFSLEEDDLKDIITDLVNESKDIVDVPITLNFRENNKVGIIGERRLVNSFYDSLMLQIMAYHGYDMLRIIILTSSVNRNYWDKYRNLPYLWNNNKSLRYFATNKDDVNKLTSYLMEEYNYRKEVASESRENVQFGIYYLILTDDIVSIKNNAFISEILKGTQNLGYSLIMSVEKLDSLPNEASMFINVEKQMSGLFTNEMTLDNQISFVPDLVDFSLKNSITRVSNIPMDINSGKYVLPTKYSFLEMFDVGNVNQLNIINRWKNNNIIKSLETPVGVDEQGELFKIDLHEKAHGPHGLVAGTTGSGKSEWIITYLLSMAVNYSPEEVQFVLIDYKGGGLALTFDNRETGVKLPHVVGTLTNLDVVEMQRSLASIASELKRRQAMFKSAREKLNESSMDIYKYQELYRAGKLTEPMSHLFIVSDEFAELKSQQPEFMDELISTARIGRSLGIHLILATQKPSGVVNDQIWSNSKFKVCLKVQDKADSNDMLKRPDAAMLKDTGRFYFQVGYNEFFALGQSAYAGSPYYESDKKITLVDSTIDFVDELGSIISRGDIDKNNTQFVHKGEELPNVLNYIIETAKTQELKITPLWLSRIPDLIYVDKLIDKYNWKKEVYYLNPVIGEYDQPNKQKQGLLTLPLSRDGNVLIYGMSGSGKENLLTTLIYSLFNSYSLYEVNMYLLDFGSGVLNNFETTPHVGDIIHSGDDEKINNLFKMIRTEMNNRKSKFMSYNGNYNDYIKSNETKMPNMVIIINQFEVFADLYDMYIESIADFTRDCAKYGIYFILTSTSTNGVRSKITQNFKTLLTLQLNDEYDYKTLFGNTNGILPSKVFGRGLIKLDNVVEFQTAFAANKEKLYEVIKNQALLSFMKVRMKAPSVPVLPDNVSIDDISNGEINITSIPIGIAKNDLSTASINLKDSISYLISGKSFDDLYNVIDGLLTIISGSNINTFVFDAKYVYEENKFKNLVYLNNNYSESLNKINDYVEQIDEILVKNNNNRRSISETKDIICIILGLEKFVNGLSEDDKKAFTNIITKSKDSLKVHFIFIDATNSLKKFEYEAWYKDSVDPSNGVWVGNGFGEQYSIKPTKMIQDYYKEIGLSFGYLVSNGSVSFIKIVEK